jgi:ubiquinone/menaquinone biosynthesis C-methylase UbiE
VGEADDLRTAYDTIAEDYAAAYPTTEPEAALDLAMLDHFARLVVDTGGTCVLDAGCGTGRMARYLADRGVQVTGLDLSPGMLAVARRDHPGVPVVEGTVTHLPFDAARFDGVLFWYSLIHVADPDLARALAEAARVLRPDGLVLVAFQVGEGVWDVGRGLRDRGHDVSLVRHHRGTKQVLDALAAAGFDAEARLVRRPLGRERQSQGFLLARLTA